MLSLIEPKYAHVPNGADDVDEDQDGAYGYVLINGGMAADARNAGIDVRRLQENPVSGFSEEVFVDTAYPRTSFACLKHICHC